IDLAVLSTSSPSSRPEMVVWPTESAPRIRARCEIDLSPGTRTVPVRGPLARASSGVGAGLEWVKIVSSAGAAVSHGPHGVTRPSNACKALLTAAPQLAK